MATPLGDVGVDGSTPIAPEIMNERPETRTYPNLGVGLEVPASDPAVGLSIGFA